MNSLPESSLVAALYLICITSLHPVQSESLSFPQETCQVETINSVTHEEFYPLAPFTNGQGLVEIKVRFRGVADGGIALSQNKNMSLPFYQLVFGSYSNQKSEIRKVGAPSVSKIVPYNTPGIMSQHQFRGFIIRYNKNTGTISATSEGNEIPLMFWKDAQPLNVTHYSFSTWTNRIIVVAFNCKNKTSKGKIYDKRFPAFYK